MNLIENRIFFYFSRLNQWIKANEYVAVLQIAEQR